MPRRTLREYTDTLQTALTPSDLYSKLGLSGDPAEAAEFRSKIEEFYRPGQTSFVVRRRDNAAPDGSEAYEGYGLRVNPAAIGESDACAFYADGTTFEFAKDSELRTWSDGLQKLSAGARWHSIVVEALANVSDKIDKAIGAKRQTDSFLEADDGVDWSAQYVHLQDLNALRLSQAHPAFGGSTFQRLAEQTEDDNCTLSVMSSPLDVSLWFVETGVDFKGEITDMIDTVWTAMTSPSLVQPNASSCVQSAAAAQWCPTSQKGKLLVRKTSGGGAATNAWFNVQDEDAYDYESCSTVTHIDDPVMPAVLGGVPSLEDKMIDKADRMITAAGVMGHSELA